MINRSVVVLFSFVWLAFVNASGQEIMLGVLEDNPGHYFGDANFRSVRVVFKKAGSDWLPFRSNCPDLDCLKTVTLEYPREVNWTIAFDGGLVGQITGRTPKDFKWYASVGQQEITSPGTVPTVGQRLTRVFEGSPVFRPLVANSQPYFQDPELWKPAKLSSDITGHFREQFRRRFPKLCRASKQDETKLDVFPYTDEDVQPVKVYGSRKGWTLVRLHLAEAIDCNDVEAGFEIDDPWFVADPKGSIKYLDSGLWLVDSGDYDNDGTSELLFAIIRDNRGGYELFYSDFEKRAVFEYSFH
jgi:hypothetical protein